MIAGGQPGDRWGMELREDGGELVGGDGSVMQGRLSVSDSDGDCLTKVLSMLFSRTFEIPETLVQWGLGGIDVEGDFVGVEEGRDTVEDESIVVLVVGNSGNNWCSRTSDGRHKRGGWSAILSFGGDGPPYIHSS